MSEVRDYRQVMSTETKQLRLLAARAATVARPRAVHLKRILFAAEPFEKASGPGLPPLGNRVPPLGILLSLCPFGWCFVA